MKSELTDARPKSLPWWTWIVPLLLIEASDQLSLLFKYSEYYSAFYLPTSVALVLVHWWGPSRVIGWAFLVGTLNNLSYGSQNLWIWPIFGFAEAASVYLSWFLFTYKLKGHPWLPDTRQTILFISLGLFIPLLFEVMIWEVAYILDGTFAMTLFWEKFNRDLLSELITHFSVAIPALFFLTPKMTQLHLVTTSDPLSNASVGLTKQNRVEVYITILVLVLITLLLPFETFWFVYGLLSLYLAIRFGFGMALAGNAYLFFISYVFPGLTQNVWLDQNFVISTTLTNTFLGTLLLYVFAAISGRVISDLKIVEEKLHRQNVELKETNQELDRFVYSVSHDLSAPLKSILGLVNISKLSDDPNDHKSYFKKIEASVIKLSVFIKEVLDYSYNKRLVLTLESIQLRELCDEIFENLKYLDTYSNLKMDLSGVIQNEFQNDRTRVKIILNNLITNAIKYQKQTTDHEPFVKVSSKRKDDLIIIEVEDNGEGIRPEVQQKIFNMFFRGHENSAGSGLGLYIAKEAAEKINGRITVKSEYGKGSIFSLHIPDLKM